MFLVHSGMDKIVTALVVLQWIPQSTSGGISVGAPGCLSPEVGRSSLNALEKLELLEIHNHFRSAVEPPATNMEKMFWSDELAEIAQNYTITCPLNPNTERNSLSTTYNAVGENILSVSMVTTTHNQSSSIEHCRNTTAAGGEDALWSFKELIAQFWFDQRERYNYQDGECLDDDVEKCVYYNQLVWANSHHVGCGLSWCDNSTTLYIICDYGPALGLNITKLNSSTNYLTRPYESVGNGSLPCSTGACSVNKTACIDRLCYDPADILSDGVSVTPPIASIDPPITTSIVIKSPVHADDLKDTTKKIALFYVLIIGSFPTLISVTLFIILIFIVIMNFKQRLQDRKIIRRNRRTTTNQNTINRHLNNTNNRTNAAGIGNNSINRRASLQLSMRRLTPIPLGTVVEGRSSNASLAVIPSATTLSSTSFHPMNTSLGPSATVLSSDSLRPVNSFLGSSASALGSNSLQPVNTSLGPSATALGSDSLQPVNSFVGSSAAALGSDSLQPVNTSLGPSVSAPSSISLNPANSSLGFIHHTIDTNHQDANPNDSAGSRVTSYQSVIDDSMMDNLHQEVGEEDTTQYDDCVYIPILHTISGIPGTFIVERQKKETLREGDSEPPIEVTNHEEMSHSRQARHQLTSANQNGEGYPIRPPISSSERMSLSRQTEIDGLQVMSGNQNGESYPGPLFQFPIHKGTSLSRQTVVGSHMTSAISSDKGYARPGPPVLSNREPVAKSVAATKDVGKMSAKNRNEEVYHKAPGYRALAMLIKKT